MPRSKYVPKCTYCRRTTFTDPVFVRVLSCFLTGVPAVETAAALKTLEPPIDVTEKTVRRHYRLIANKIHDKYLSGLFALSDQEIKTFNFFLELSNEKNESLRAEARRNLVYKMWHDQWIHPENDVLMNDHLVGHIVRKYQDSPFMELDIAAMYRELSKRKFGITSSIKENLALAAIRSIVKYNMGERETKGWSMSERAELQLLAEILHGLSLDPC